MEIRWSDERYQTVLPLAGGRRASFSPHRTVEYLRIQLETCKQKNEELEMRALTAEMEATHQNLEMNNVQEEVAQREATIRRLERDLKESRKNASTSEKNLARFQRKINRLRVALTKEIEKIKLSESEARSSFNLLFHSVLQYRSNEISKEDFFSAVSEMESMYAPSVPSPPVATQSTIALEHVKAKEEDAQEGKQQATDTYSTQPNIQTSHIHSLVCMLSEQGMAVSTDDELLDENKKSKLKVKHRLFATKSKRITNAEEDAASLVTSEETKVSDSVPSVEKNEDETKGLDLHSFLEENKNESKGLKVHPSLDLHPCLEGNENESTGLKLHPSLNLHPCQEENGDESEGSDLRPSSHVLKRRGSLRSIEYFPFMGVRSIIAERKGYSDSDNSDFEMFVPPKRKQLPDNFGVEPYPEAAEAAFASPTPELPTKGNDSISSPVPPPLPPKKVVSPSSKRAVFGKKSVSTNSFYYESINSRYETMLDLEPMMRAKSQPDICDASSDGGNCRGGAVVDVGERKSSKPKRGSDPSPHPLPPLPSMPPLDLESGHVEDDYDSDDSLGCTYLDPKDLESQPVRRVSVENVDEKREVSSMYLTLVEVRNEQASHKKRFSKVSQSSVEPDNQGQTQLETKSSFKLNIGKGVEKWMPDSSCASGYSTDSSSNCEQDGDSERSAPRRKLVSNPDEAEEPISSLDFSYFERGKKPAVRRRKTSQSCPGDFGEGDIYAEIDDYDVDGGDDKDEYVTFHNARSAVEAPPTSVIPAQPSDDTYESMYQEGGMIIDSQSFPPSLPPRLPKKAPSRVPRNPGNAQVIKRHTSVPLDQLEYDEEDKDASSSRPPPGSFSPSRIRRAPAIHGGNHTFSPLVVQAMKPDKDQIGSSHGDFTNLAQRGKASTLPHMTQGTEKTGFLKKMDPKMKNWNRRWFVLKGMELRYFKTNKKSMKGVIYLDSWCKLGKGATADSFQLETQKRVYYLGCSSEKERNEWVKAIEAKMQLQQPLEANTVEEKGSFVRISGFAQVTLNGQPQRLWCVLKGSILTISQAPGSMTLQQVKILESTVRKKRESIILDSVSSSDFLSILFTVQGSPGLTEIQPVDQSDKDSWYYYLCSTQLGDMDVQLTSTEKLLAEIEQSLNALNHKLWSHPVFSMTTGPLSQSLVTLPSGPLNESAKSLFQNIQTFIHTQVASHQTHDFSFHVLLVQDIVGACLDHVPLQDEAYCQILRQITGHHSADSVQVTHGWLLLSLLLSSFLPIRPRILWYLQTFLTRQCSSHWPAVAGYARNCKDILSSALDLGQRRRKPSFLELSGVLEKFSESGTTLEHEVSIPVHLEDGSNVEVEFNPFTTIRDLVTLVNSRTDLPDTSLTGFGVFCDWPGVESLVCCCSFLDTKVVDLIAVWFAALEQLNSAGTATDKPFKYQRTIQLAYKKCLFLRQRVGSETDKEAVLLAYQISKYIHSGEFPAPSVDKAVSMAALLSQMEYGDWNVVKQQRKKQGEGEEEVARDAVLLFCPWKMTHLALDHDLMSLQKRLEDQWKVLVGMNREECARRYVGVAQEWNRYGSTSFQTEEAGSSPQRPVQLTISEKGVSIFNRAGTTVISSFTYADISTFGGTTDNTFMLIISSQSRRSSSDLRNGSQITAKRNSSSKKTVEKLTFVMPKLKVCEASYLMASYIGVNQTSNPHLGLISDL